LTFLLNIYRNIFKLIVYETLNLGN